MELIEWWNFEKKFWLKNYRASFFTRVPLLLLLPSSLVPATILLHCPRKFARWRSIINHQLLPFSLSFVPLTDIRVNRTGRLTGN